jgi:glycerophosphoryl diester phosphodiesterase
VIENSHAAFEAAIVGGYAIECDVQLASDRVPFIFHDDDFDRLTKATGPSDAKPIADVQKLVLTDSADGDVPQTFDQFLALAESVALSLAGYRGPYTLESFDPNLLVALRKAGVRAPLGIITYGYDEPDWDTKVTPWQRVVLRNLLHWPLTRFDFISCRNVSLGLPAVRMFRALGVPVTSWTIKSAADASAALRQADQIVFEGFLPASA